MRRYLVTAAPFIYTALFAGAILLSVYAGLHYGLWAAVTVMASAFILLVVPGIIIGVPDPDDDWHWEQFAKQFDRQKFPSESDCVYGKGAIPNFKQCREYSMKVAVNADGILLEYVHAEHRPTALIPWTRIQNLVHATVVNIMGKQCNPFQIAHIYIDLFDSPIAVPWQASFNKSVPERIGFTSTGPVEIR